MTSVSSKRKSKPKESLSQLHKRLDNIFSRYIRTRDCLETTGSIERGACITCKKVYEFSSLQAGHFVSRGKYSVRYDERNVHGQCTGCNLFKHGALDDYFVALEEKYGRDTVNELLSLKHTTRRFTREELKELIEHYKRKVKELNGQS